GPLTRGAFPGNGWHRRGGGRSGPSNDATLEIQGFGQAGLVAPRNDGVNKPLGEGVAETAEGALQGEESSQKKRVRRLFSVRAPRSKRDVGSVLRGRQPG